MVREITLFEMHFDGSHFGPTFGGDEADEAEEKPEDAMSEDVETAAAAPSGGGIAAKLGRVVLVVGLLAVLAVVGRRVRRRFDSGEDTEEVTFDEFEAADSEESAPEA